MAKVNHEAKATISLLHNASKNVGLTVTNTFDLSKKWTDSLNPGFTVNMKS
mgnify:CR=1 FL=1